MFRRIPVRSDGIGANELVVVNRIGIVNLVIGAVHLKVGEGGAGVAVVPERPGKIVDSGGSLSIPLRGLADAILPNVGRGEEDLCPLTGRFLIHRQRGGRTAAGRDNDQLRHALRNVQIPHSGISG